MEHFAYNGAYLICGSCGSSMSPYNPQQRPWKLQVCCFNNQCIRFCRVFDVGDEHKVSLRPAGIIAPDPFVMTNGPTALGTTMQAGGGAVAIIPDQLITVDQNGRITRG